MRSAAEWEEWMKTNQPDDGLSDAEVWAFICHAVQADALATAKTNIVRALQGDYYLEHAESVVVSKIDDLLKPEGP